MWVFYIHDELTPMTITYVAKNWIAIGHCWTRGPWCIQPILRLLGKFQHDAAQFCSWSYTEIDGLVLRIHTFIAISCWGLHVHNAGLLLFNSLYVNLLRPKKINVSCNPTDPWQKHLTPRNLCRLLVNIGLLPFEANQNGLVRRFFPNDPTCFIFIRIVNEGFLSWPYLFYISVIYGKKRVKNPCH